jgi:hypothetical protein
MQDVSPAFSAALLRPTVLGGGAARRGDGAGAIADMLYLPSPDWLKHQLTVSGPRTELALFQAAAAGPGVIPWQQDGAALVEGWFNHLVGPSPAERTVSVAGARALARQLRDAVEAHWVAYEDVRRARASPLDLHALVPVRPGRHSWLSAPAGRRCVSASGPSTRSYSPLRRQRRGRKRIGRRAEVRRGRDRVVRGVRCTTHSRSLRRDLRLPRGIAGGDWMNQDRTERVVLVEMDVPLARELEGSEERTGRSAAPLQNRVLPAR